MNTFVEEIAGFKLILDPYNGVTIEENTQYGNKTSFEKNLILLILQLEKEKRKLLWITFDLKNSHLIEIAAKQGFTFHNCDTNYVMMVKKLIENPIIPTSPTHTIGVGAVVINDKNEILVIKERILSIGYKLPGGHIDLGEKIADAVCREVLEETGIIVEFESIITLSQFHPHQFGKGNIYILCNAKATSYEINIQDTDEIIDAKWIDVEVFLKDETVFEYVKEIVKSSQKFEGLKLKDLESFKNFPKKYELFFPTY